MDTARTLYTLAEQADARLTATIAARTNGRRDRWTVTAADMIAHPEIREALSAKITADEAWLTFLRTNRPRTVEDEHLGERYPMEGEGR